MKAIRFGECEPQAWDRLVSSSPDGWVWALSGWQRLILDVHEWALEEHSFALADDNGGLLGVMPLHYQAAGRRMASSGWGVAGPVIAGSLLGDERVHVQRALLTEAERLSRQCGATRLELGVSPLVPTSIQAAWGVNPFITFGFRDTSTTTRILDLSLGEDRIWSAVSQNAKRKIKRARARGISVQRVDWPAMVDAYYDAHRETYIRTGVVPHPRAYFEGLAREMSPHGHAVLLAAFADGTPIAFRNDARFGAGVLYHTGCSLNAALDNGANYLLVWESIVSAIRDGYRWYELGEVFLDARAGKSYGLTEFKSRFGGDLHRYFKGVLDLEPVDAPAAAAPTTSETGASTPAPAEPRRSLLRSLARVTRERFRQLAGGQS